jgi:excisionase family DNA binding protein
MARTEHTPPRTPQLIGAKPASREYGIKYTSLRDIVHRGELPCIRIGRAMYLDRVDVERWIETRKERA